MSSRRALHYVFRISDRRQTIKFYKDVLGMQVLRHEEFKEGCAASCNGPYDGSWSKTMVGYGSEDNHFVLELTYNYGIGSYKLGNDFNGITIHSDKVIPNAAKFDWLVKEIQDKKYVESPDGHKYFIDNVKSTNDPVEKVSLHCSSLSRSIDYWHGKCGMKIYSQDDKSALLAFGDEQCKLELKDLGTQLDNEGEFGRVAFSCPKVELESIQDLMKSSGETILHPLISLDTPGKATVHVVILKDPDGHQICFVGDESYRELSQFDPKGYELLEKAMDDDKSDQWFARRGGKKNA